MTTLRPLPDWFTTAEEANPGILERIAAATRNLKLPLKVALPPTEAFWFLLNSMQIANRANRDGMHANALAITRQCLEAISILELGLVPSAEAVTLLERWQDEKVSAGEIRKWLEEHVWTSYGQGLWSEAWADFMGKLCKAIQPYPHYSPKLAQWQARLHEVRDEPQDEGITAIIECGPATYDPQKATRITLFHALISFALARIWIVHNRATDAAFEALIERLRVALGKSRYLDGNHTKWDEQFWAMMWFKDGNHAPSRQRGSTIHLNVKRVIYFYQRTIYNPAQVRGNEQQQNLHGHGGHNSSGVCGMDSLDCSPGWSFATRTARSGSN
jgi:hypothetical protein